MANEPENLVLRACGVIDEKVDRLRDHVRELKTGLNGVRRDLIALAEGGCPALELDRRSPG